MFRNLRESLSRKVQRKTKEEERRTPDIEHPRLNVREITNLSKRITAADISQLEQLRGLILQYKAARPSKPFPVHLAIVVRDEHIVDLMTSHKQNELNTLLESHDYIVVFSTRRVGKTSLFQRLAQSHRFRQVDVQSKMGEETMNEFLSRQKNLLNFPVIIFDEVYFDTFIDDIISFFSKFRAKPKLIFSTPSIAGSFRNIEKLRNLDFVVMNFGVFHKDQFKKFMQTHYLMDAIPDEIKEILIEMSAGSLIVLNNLIYEFFQYLSNKEETDSFNLLMQICQKSILDLNSIFEYWSLEREKFASHYPDIDQVVPRIPAWYRLKDQSSN